MPKFVKLTQIVVTGFYKMVTGFFYAVGFIKKKNPAEKTLSELFLFSYHFHSSRREKRFPNPRRWPLPLTQHQNHHPRRFPTHSMRNDPRTLELVSI